MGWIEQRIGTCETRLEYLLRLVNNLTAQLQGNRQAIQGTYQRPDDTGTTGGGAFFADFLTLGGCAGALTGATPTSTTGDVYRIDSGAFVLVASGATILNGLPDATDNTMRQILAQNTDNTYTVTGQSCTTP